MGEADIGFRTKLCVFFGLDRSSQYKRHVRAATDETLARQLRAVRIEHPAYGHRRLAMQLGCSKNRVRRVMKACGILPPSRRKKYAKANGGTKPAPPNLLKDQALIAVCAHHIWAEDFTYLWFQNRFYYLATVIDLYSRQIVGWSLGTRHDTSLIAAALLDAVSHYEPPNILHNDRGSEYLSAQYKTLCVSLEITLSASAPGSPWQNGFQESFYNNFKYELGNISKLEHEGQLLAVIAMQLHYYNTKRIHSTLGTSPAAYAARRKQKEETRAQQITPEVRDKMLTKVGT